MRKSLPLQATSHFLCTRQQQLDHARRLHQNINMANATGKSKGVAGRRRAVLVIPGRIVGLLILILALVVFDAAIIEPRWVKVRRISLAEQPTHRFILIADVHYKGAFSYLSKVVDRINRLNPDFVCLAGDLVETADMLPEVLQILSGINAPLYAVPGNHDYWCNADFDLARKVLDDQGGAFLESDAVLHLDGRIQILGDSLTQWDYQSERVPAAKHIFMTHYPDKALRLEGPAFDTILAGHSHGGQIRLPFIGAIVKMTGAEHFQKGLYPTDHGPLYVNPGLGTYFLELRFLCRPEITIIEI